MKYMLLIYGEDSQWEQRSKEEQDAIQGEYFEIAQVAGVVGGDQLQPGETATTVRVNGSGTLTTDGPFIDTKEGLAGFYLYQADDLDAAIELAARIPLARNGGAIEVRPVVER